MIITSLTHRVWRGLFLLTFVTSIIACSTVTPEPAHTDFELPTEFVAKATTDGRTPAELWWRDFGDSQLNQFVDVALVRNPGLAQAVARTRIAEAQTRVQRAEQLPQIGLGAGVTRQRQNLSIQPGASSATQEILSTSHNATLDISWELDLWGQLAALSAAARADYLASGEQLRALRQSVAAQVVRMYFEVVHAWAQVDLSERTVTSLAEMHRQINNRVNEGIASPTDGQLAQANMDTARAGLEQRREALERSLRQLEILMGDYPAGTLATAQMLPDVPSQPSTGIPAELLARRPDVRAAELGLLSAGYQLGAAQRSFLPSLSLSGSAGYAGSELSDLFSSGNLIWSIAGRLLQPVFQGGRLIAQVDITEGQRDEALHTYAETALNALSEVETALAVDTLLAQREAALASSAQAAEQAVTTSYNRYSQGIDPFLPVLESQQRELDSRSAHITAHFARLENRIALHLALGGGFENEPLPTATASSPQ